VLLPLEHALHELTNGGYLVTAWLPPSSCFSSGAMWILEGATVTGKCRKALSVHNSRNGPGWPMREVKRKRWKWVAALREVVTGLTDQNLDDRLLAHVQFSRGVIELLEGLSFGRIERDRSRELSIDKRGIIHLLVWCC
jgi:hypothetical protein